MSLTKHEEFYAEELLQEFTYAIMKVDTDKVLDMCQRNEFGYYSVVVIRNLVYNKTSVFNMNYDINDHSSLEKCGEIANEEEDESGYFVTEDAEVLIDKIDAWLGKRAKGKVSDWYNKEVFDLYYGKDTTFVEMSEELNIPSSSLWRTVDFTRKRIKARFKNEYNKICLNANEK